MTQDVPLFGNKYTKNLNQIQANTYRENNNSNIYYQLNMRYAWKQIHEKFNQIQTNIYSGTAAQISIIN